MVSCSKMVIREYKTSEMRREEVRNDFIFFLVSSLPPPLADPPIPPSQQATSNPPFPIFHLSLFPYKVTLLFYQCY